MTGEVFDIIEKLGYDSPKLNARIEIVPDNFNLIDFQENRIKWSVDFYIKVFIDTVGRDQYLFNYIYEKEHNENKDYNTNYETIKYVDTLHSIDVNAIKTSQIIFKGTDYYKDVCNAVKCRTRLILRYLGRDDLDGVCSGAEMIDDVFNKQKELKNEN